MQKIVYMIYYFLHFCVKNQTMYPLTKNIMIKKNQVLVK